MKSIFPEQHVTVHGLRSVIKNYMGSHGVRPDIKEACIGHRTGINLHYGDVESDELGQMRAAMRMWDDYLAGRREWSEGFVGEAEPEPELAAAA